PTTFEYLGWYWAKDHERTYFQEHNVPGIQPTRLRMLEYDYATDGSLIYGFAGLPLAPYGQPNSLGRGYFRIGDVILFAHSRVEHADPTTFTLLPSLTPAEKRAIW